MSEAHGGCQVSAAAKEHEQPQQSGGGQRGTRICGYLTVYMALTLSVTLPLIFVLIRGTRLGAARMQLESIAHISQNAVLSEFHIALHERYDLFAVDTSYGGGSGVLANTEQHLRSYVEQNAACGGTVVFGTPVNPAGVRISSMTLPEARYLCDNNAQAVREQVYAYMTADPAGSIFGEVLAGIDQWKGLEISGGEWQTRTQESEETLLRTLREKREDVQSDVEQKDNNQEYVTQTEREAASDVPSEAEEMVQNTQSFQFLPILHQVLGEDAELSEQTVEEGQLLSKREVWLGSGLKASNTHDYPRANELMFDAYIMEKTGRYTAMLEDGKLKYQTEYILCGKSSDKENLEKVAERLLLIREAVNCPCLFSDEGRMSQIHTVAAIVSLIMLNPDLEEVLADAIALAWSYLESVQDVHSLLIGRKVPVVKTPENWQTDLFDLLSPGAAIRDRGGDEGLSYEEYLAGLLYIEGSTTKTKRTMDIMELDIREITQDPDFALDRCLDTILTEISAEAIGTEFSFSGTAGYD